MTKNAPRTARERARAELTTEITATARRHLAESGPTGLSVRAVARELGMASSAVYRYFPSRDALLTRLIIEAYDDLGDACDRAVAAVRPGNLGGVWRGLASAVRDWAVANPHDYALIYGSPVPGYAAPQDTVGSASRVLRHLVVLSVGLDEAGAPVPDHVPVSRSLGRQISALLDDEDLVIDRQRLMAVVNAWAFLFGTVSFEVFGRYNGMFDDVDALFAHQVDRMGCSIGLPLPSR